MRNAGSSSQDWATVWLLCSVLSNTLGQTLANPGDLRSQQSRPAGAGPHQNARVPGVAYTHETV